MGVAANPMMWYSIAAAAIDDTQELLGVHWRVFSFLFE
jgi:hypothetical protein